VGHVDACGDNDDKSPLTLVTQAVETESQDWRADRRNGGTAHRTLVQLVHVTYVKSFGGRLLLLSDPVNDDPSTIVGHRCEVLGEVGLCDAFCRGQVLLPVEVVGLFEMLIDCLIKHVVKQRSRLAAKQSV
jgi:hypothetical protein